MNVMKFLALKSQKNDNNRITHYTVEIYVKELQLKFKKKYNSMNKK